MLEAAVVRRPGFNHGVGPDLGRILDAMLFYGRVHLVLDFQLTTALVMQLGVKGATDLLHHSTVTATFTPEFCAVQANTAGGLETHRPIIAQMRGNRERILSMSDGIGSIHHTLRNQKGLESIRRRDVEKMLSKAKQNRFRELLGVGFSEHQLFSSIVEDIDSLKLFVHSWAKSKGLSIDDKRLEKLPLNVVRLRDDYIVTCPISPSSIFENNNSRVDWGSILNNAFDYSLDLFFSQKYSGDFISSPEVSQISSVRMDLSIQRAIDQAREIHAFEEMVFESSRQFGTAFNEGRINLSDALKTIDKSRKMHEWLHGLNPDANLLREYTVALEKDTILQKLPGSTARFAFFNGAGIALDALLGSGGVGISAGLGLSAVDHFTLEKILGGWRPNVFVDNVKKITGSGR